MYDLADLKKPYKIICELLGDADFMVGISFALIHLLISIIIVGIRLVLYKIGICAELDYDLFWKISFYIAGSLIFYPITFTIIYTPIALLLAIPVVLYKNVFKLGDTK